MTGTKEQGTTAGMLTTQEPERTGKRTARRRNWAGILLGAGLALTLAVFAEPMEAQAATCNISSSCDGFNDPNMTHTHIVKLNGVIKGGHFTDQVDVVGTSTIENGTFDVPMYVGKFGRNDVTLTIQDGNFSSITVYENAVIHGGTFRLISTSNNSIITINDGTFCRQLELKGTTTINGGIFKEKVLVKPDANTKTYSIKGGTFMGGIQDNNSNPIDLDKIEATAYTVTFQYEDGSTEQQIIVGTGKACKPNGSKWVYFDDPDNEYDFDQTVSEDLTLTEIAPSPSGQTAGEGSSSSSASRIPADSQYTGSTGTGHKTQKSDAQDDTQEQTQNLIPEHVCQYEWVTVREAGVAADGEKRLTCKLCGSVEAVEVISASDYRYAQLYDAVSLAGENETVTYDLENFFTISDKLLTALQNRRDVALVLTFTYQGRQYEALFPAGADYTELLEDQDSFYGLLGLRGRCGISVEERAAADADWKVVITVE